MKVAYIGEYGKYNGTYYRQRVTMTKDEFFIFNAELKFRYNNLLDRMENKKVHSTEELYYKCYGKPLEENEDNRYELNLTQYGVLRDFLPNKRYTDNNTIVYVKG